MSTNKCARCEQTVYPVEGLRCLDKIWHKGCFKCHECNMTLNMKNYKGFEKRPYCNAHCPQAKATTVADTPEIRRLAENTRIQSQAKYHEDFEKSKGKGFTTIADDPETRRVKETSKIISNVAYHGELEKKKQMEGRREVGGSDIDEVSNMMMRMNSGNGNSNSYSKSQNRAQHNNNQASTDNSPSRLDYSSPPNHLAGQQQQQLLMQQQQMLLKQKQQQHYGVQNGHSQQQPILNRHSGQFNGQTQQQQQLQHNRLSQPQLPLNPNSQQQQQHLMMRQQHQQVIMQAQQQHQRHSLDPSSMLMSRQQPSKQAIISNSHQPSLQQQQQQQYLMKQHSHQQLMTNQAPQQMMKYVPMSEVNNQQAMNLHHQQAPLAGLPVQQQHHQARALSNGHLPLAQAPPNGHHHHQHQRISGPALSGVASPHQMVPPNYTSSNSNNNNSNSHPQMNGFVPSKQQYFNPSGPPPQHLMHHMQQAASQQLPLGQHHPSQMRPMTMQQLQALNAHQPHHPQAPLPMTRRVFRAMFDYVASAADEVSFVENDILIECVNVDRNWLIGKVARTGQTGMLPANYVNELPSQ